MAVTFGEAHLRDSLNPFCHNTYYDQLLCTGTESKYFRLYKLFGSLLRTTGWALVFRPSSSLKSPKELLKLLPIGLRFCCCTSTTLFWCLSLCGIVWSQGGWFFQLHSSFSRLFWLFGVFSVSLRNLYAGQEATELDIEQQTGSKLGKEYLKYIELSVNMASAALVVK